MDWASGIVPIGRRDFLKGASGFTGALASISAFGKLVGESRAQAVPLEVPREARNVEAALAQFVAAWEVAGPAILLTRFGRFLSNRIFNCHVVGTPRVYNLTLGAAGALLAPGASPLAHASLEMSEESWLGVLYGDYTGLAPILAGEMFPSRDEANRATLLAIVFYVFAHIPASNRNDPRFFLESFRGLVERGGLPGCESEASALEVVDDIERDPEGAVGEVLFGADSVPPVTRRLAEFVHGIDYATIPAADVAAAKEQLKSILGVAYAGLHMEPGKKLVAAVQGFGESGPSTALGFPASFRTSARNAAMVNSFLAQILEWEDWTFLTHSGAAIVPVVLAAAEVHGRSGRDVLAAIVAGNEILARAGEFLTDVVHTGNAQAVHQTELPLLAASLLGLPIEAMQDASGIACTQPQGTSIPSWTADAKGMLTAWPAYTSVMAAELAAAGLSGRRDLLENPLGYFYRVADISSPRQLERILAGLGTDWRFAAELFTKRYPTDGFQLPAVHAALGARAKAGLGAIPRAELPERIERILFRIPLVMGASATMFGKGEVGLLDRILDPAEPDWTYIALLFDGRYPLAAALADGELTHRQYLPDKIADGVIRALYPRIEMVPDLTMGVFGAQATITVDGEDVTEFVGCIREEVNADWDPGEKMRVGAAGLRTPQQIEDVLAAIDELESFSDIRDLTAML